MILTRLIKDLIGLFAFSFYMRMGWCRPQTRERLHRGWAKE